MASSAAGGLDVTSFLRTVADGVRKANALPAGDDFHYADSFPEFREDLEKVRAELRSLLETVHGFLWDSSQTAPKHLPRHFPEHPDWQDIKQMVQASLEETDHQLDAYRRVNKHKDPQVPLPQQTFSTMDPRSVHQQLAKPQRKWKDLVDNSPGVFKPILVTKPFARRPLQLRLLQNGEEALEEGEQRSSSGSFAALQAHLSHLGISLDEESETSGGYEHPYKFEIENLMYALEHVTGPPGGKPRLFNGMDGCSCSFIDRVEELVSLAETLSGVSEIAVDLEHHSERSYLGFTCLMQLSTRDEDFVVDTLALRRHMHLLAPVFANPAIVKVFHGADRDIQWLQRDFGIYVVNLFDTSQAARVLEFPRFSLAYLLNQFCSVQPQKKYQKADWRVRPLPDEQFEYARMDTHFLLYIYDRLRMLAVERSRERRLDPVSLTCVQSGERETEVTCQVPALLHSILARSQAVALRRFEKPQVPTAQTATALIRRYNLVLTDFSARALQLLAEWRDRIARTLDESLNWILPNFLMFSICEAMPSEHATLVRILRISRLSSSRLSLLMNHADKIIELIQEAKLMPCSPLVKAASLSVVEAPAMQQLALEPQLSSSLTESPLSEQSDLGARARSAAIPGFDAAALTILQARPNLDHILSRPQQQQTRQVGGGSQSPPTEVTLIRGTKLFPESWTQGAKRSSSLPSAPQPPEFVSSLGFGEARGKDEKWILSTEDIGAMGIEDEDGKEIEDEPPGSESVATASDAGAVISGEALTSQASESLIPKYRSIRQRQQKQAQLPKKRKSADPYPVDSPPSKNSMAKINAKLMNSRLVDTTTTNGRSADRKRSRKVKKRRPNPNQTHQ